MDSKKLNIISTDDTSLKPKRTAPTKASKRITAKATLDRLYLLDKDQFNPSASCLGRKRIRRTIALIEKAFAADGKKVADLGTGFGDIALHLSKNSKLVDAVDIADFPKTHLENENRENITFFQDYIPFTTLESDHYDLVLGLDLIAYLNPSDYRLFMAELSRLVKSDGLVVASTSIDIYSEDALQNFASLAETEFTVDEWILSYDSYYIRLLSFFEAPSIFVKASQDEAFYKKELNKRFSVNRALFKLNTTKIGAFFWSFCKIFTNPLHKFLKNNSFIMRHLETICQFFSSESGISHAIFIGKRRKIFEDEPVVQRKGKHEIWE